MKLGEKMKNNAEAMYPSAVKSEEPPEIIHKQIGLPLKLLGDLKVKKGQRICVKIEGDITEIHDSDWNSEFRMKVEEGEVLEEPAGDGDKGAATFLGGEEKE